MDWKDNTTKKTLKLFVCYIVGSALSRLIQPVYKHYRGKLQRQAIHRNAGIKLNKRSYELM